MNTVIIRSKNEQRYIGYCIQSVTDFIGKPKIVLIDNESTDDTITIVNRFEYHDITKLHISKDDYTPGRALNMGVNESEGDWIIIISAHCEIVHLDLDKVRQHFSDPAVVAVWGKQIPIWDGKKITRRYMWSNFGDESKINYFCKFEDRYFLHNGFSFYMKKILKEFPFDERLSGKEDRYWAKDRIKEGYRILYNPELVCKHNYTVDGATWKIQ